MVSVNRKAETLGKCLLRSRLRNNKKPVLFNDDEDAVFPDLSVEKKTRESITKSNDIDELLVRADVGSIRYYENKSEVKLIFRERDIEKVKVNAEALDSFKKLSRIPRRPLWDTIMGSKEFESLEKTEFLNWRRALSQYQDNNEVTITPYERNIEIWRQFWIVIEKSDLIVQIVDARNPLLFYCDDIFDYAKSICKNKRFFSIVNKADLLTSSQIDEWASYFRTKNIDFVFYSAIGEEDVCSGQQDASLQDNAGFQEKYISSNFILNRDQLVALLEKFRQMYFSDKKYVVGMLGYPNVGKSSTINSLLNLKKVSTAPTPGKTKYFQTIYLTNEICLCDCPGLVFPNIVNTNAELITNGILSIDQMTDCIGATAIVVKNIPLNILEYQYKISFSGTKINVKDSTSLAHTFLSLYAISRGYRTTSRGSPDESRASRYVLKDYVAGNLIYVVPPPTYTKDTKEFNKRNNYSAKEILNIIDGEYQRKIKKSVAKLDDDLEHDLKMKNSVARIAGKYYTGQFTRFNPMNPTENMINCINVRHNGSRKQSRHKN